jgi:molecular chaperone DnaJ
MPPQAQDYYDLLGVERGSSDDDIKRSFRRLARQYHPDANPGDPEAEERFKAINEAYEVLSDPDKRARYDRFGHAGLGGPGAGGPGAPFGGIEDIFEAFFGGFGRDIRGRATGPERGPDLEMSLSVELAEAARGLEREVEINRIESCHICGGNGARPGTRPERCRRCGGSGQVTVAQSTMFGRVMTSRTCDACGGRGVMVTDPCPECDGRGLVRRLRRVNVKIPAGIPDQTRLRLSGQGQGGLRGGPPGDLYVEVRVLPHPRLARQGNDIFSEMRVSYLEALLGGVLDVETLWATQTIELPAGTQPGDSFVLRGQGMPDVRGYGRGDHHVSVRVEIPRRLSPRQRELLRELAVEGGLAVTASGSVRPGEGDAAGAAAREDRDGGRGAPAGRPGKATAPSAGPANKPKQARRPRKRGLIDRVKDFVAGEPEDA